MRKQQPHITLIMSCAATKWSPSIGGRRKSSVHRVFSFECFKLRHDKSSSWPFHMTSSPVPSPPSDSVRFHNATSHAEGTDWRLSWFSACSAMEGFSLQSQRGILSPTIELLDASESGFFCCPADGWDHGKAVFLPQTPKYTLTAYPQQADIPND